MSFAHLPPGVVDAFIQVVNSKIRSVLIYRFLSTWTKMAQTAILVSKYGVVCTPRCGAEMWQ